MNQCATMPILKKMDNVMLFATLFVHQCPEWMVYVHETVPLLQLNQHTFTLVLILTGYKSVCHISSKAQELHSMSNAVEVCHVHIINNNKSSIKLITTNNVYIIFITIEYKLLNLSSSRVHWITVKYPWQMLSLFSYS